MKYKLYIIILSAFFTSCTNDDFENRQIALNESFNEVILKDAFTLYIDEGESYRLEVLAKGNTGDEVVTNLENGVLTIEDRRKFKWITPSENSIQIHITSPSINKIKISDGCSVFSNYPIKGAEFGIVITGKSVQANIELDCDVFYYWNNFPVGGKLTLRGKTRVLKLWNYPLMSVDAKQLDAEDAIVVNNSPGNIEISVSNKLEYSIPGEGNIILYSNPKFIFLTEKTTKGKLIIQP